MRGKLAKLEATWEASGSIPASAGKTTDYAHIPQTKRVYPRECGENVKGRLMSLKDTGLSPRVRGKPVHQQSVTSSCGSIPASAGKTLELNTLISM